MSLNRYSGMGLIVCKEAKSFRRCKYESSILFYLDGLIFYLYLYSKNEGLARKKIKKE